MKNDTTRRKNLEGAQYGKLTVLHRAGDDTWLFRCNCGREIEVKHSDLTHQLVKSCGCIKDITGKSKAGSLL